MNLFWETCSSQFYSELIKMHITVDENSVNVTYT